MSGVAVPESKDLPPLHRADVVVGTIASYILRRETTSRGNLARRSDVGMMQAFHNVSWFRGTAGFVAGTLGRVSAENGIAELLEAAAAARGSGILFAVAGAGEMVSAVELAGTNVCYAGYLARPDLYIAQLDVYVQASRSDVLSPGLLEAMRYGKAIVATDVGAASTAFTHGENALLVPPCQAQRLLDAILTLKGDMELAARLGSAARMRFEARFRRLHRHKHALDFNGLGE
jgi:glycosyltransferase involved in cell wall biosynthesis